VSSEGTRHFDLTKAPVSETVTHWELIDPLTGVVLWSGLSEESVDEVFRHVVHVLQTWTPDEDTRP
jgi:hypothetical protein